MKARVRIGFSVDLRGEEGRGAPPHPTMKEALRGSLIHKEATEVTSGMQEEAAETSGRDRETREPDGEIKKAAGRCFDHADGIVFLSLEAAKKRHERQAVHLWLLEREETAIERLLLLIKATRNERDRAPDINAKKGGLQAAAGPMRI